MLTSIFLATIVFAHGKNLGDDNTELVQTSALVPNTELVREVVDAAADRIRQGADSALVAKKAARAAADAMKQIDELDGTAGSVEVQDEISTAKAVIAQLLGQASSTSLRRKQDAIQISSIKASSASCDGCSSGGCDPRGPDRLISGCDSTACNTVWACGGPCDAGVLTVNGNGQGEWCSKGGSAASEGGQWLDIDLGSEYSVSKIELWSGASGSRFPQELQILTGGSIDDGSTGSGTSGTRDAACFNKVSGTAADSGGWTAAGGPYTIGAGTTLTGCENARNKAGVNTQVDTDKCEVDVTGVTGQHIRLWFRGTAGNDNYMELRQVKVFGSAAEADYPADCDASKYFMSTPYHQTEIRGTSDLADMVSKCRSQYMDAGGFGGWSQRYSNGNGWCARFTRAPTQQEWDSAGSSHCDAYPGASGHCGAVCGTSFNSPASGPREANCLAYPYQNGFYRNRFYEGCGYVGSLGGWQQCQDKCNECGESACRAACRNGCDYMKCESDSWKNKGCAMTNPQCVDNGGWATPDCTEGASSSSSLKRKQASSRSLERKQSPYVHGECTYGHKYGVQTCKGGCVRTCRKDPENSCCSLAKWFTNSDDCNADPDEPGTWCDEEGNPGWTYLNPTPAPPQAAAPAGLPGCVSSDNIITIAELNACLGANGGYSQVEHISYHSSWGNWDYLDSVCDAFFPGATCTHIKGAENTAREVTPNQGDVCTGGASDQYPGWQGGGWLRTNRVENGCERVEADGIICSPQAAAAQWFISPDWSGSCDEVCAQNGRTCDQTALDDLSLSGTNMNPTALSDAYEGATGSSITCNTWNTGCSGGNCPNWGLPFIHSSHFGDDKLCWGGDAVAACGQTPVDGHHRRLCPCQ